MTQKDTLEGIQKGIRRIQCPDQSDRVGKTAEQGMNDVFKETAYQRIPRQYPRSLIHCMIIIKKYTE